MFSRHKISIVDLQRGGDDATDIDLRLVTKHDASGIDDEHLPVGFDFAVDLRGPRRGDAIEHGGATIRLFDVDFRFMPDVEALPIDDSARAGLVDGHLCTGLRDLRGTSGDLATTGQRSGGGIGSGKTGEGAEESGDERQRRRESRHGTAACVGEIVSCRLSVTAKAPL